MAAAVTRLAFVHVQPAAGICQHAGLIIRLSRDGGPHQRDDLCHSHWLIRPDCQPLVVGARFAQPLEQESRSVAITDHSHRAISDGEPGRGPARLKHGTVRVMVTKAERRAARERVSAHHESQLAGLLGHVGAEIDRYRAGEIDAYAADETIHRYHRAAAELWKFCFARGGGAHVAFVADLLDRMTADAETIDWWERAAPRRHQ